MQFPRVNFRELTEKSQNRQFLSTQTFIHVWYNSSTSTTWKGSVLGVFLIRIQSACWKIRTRKTPNTDTHVLITRISFHFTFRFWHWYCKIFIFVFLTSFSEKKRGFIFFLLLLIRHQFTLLLILISLQFLIHSSRSVHWCSRKKSFWIFKSNCLVTSKITSPKIFEKFLLRHLWWSPFSTPLRLPGCFPKSYLEQLFRGKFIFSKVATCRL